MDRKIKLSDIKVAIQEAYNSHNNELDGGVCQASEEKNKGKFGISLRLADGTKFDIGHTQTDFALGAIAMLPLTIRLLMQMSPSEFVEKMGFCKQKCDSGSDSTSECSDKHKIKGLHRKGVRAASLVEPIGDFDGKMGIMSNLLVDLMGTSPVLDYQLYEASRRKSEEKNDINKFAEIGYELYDDAGLSIDLYNRLRSMLVTSEQLADMGATIAADGVNPKTGMAVFESALSASVCAMMAVKGPKHIGKPWLIKTGVPAVSGFGGGFLAVIPGLGAIASFSPELNDIGLPVRAACAVKDILTRLQLNVFSSKKVCVVD